MLLLFVGAQRKDL